MLRCRFPCPLALTDEQRREFVATRDHAAQPYLRERAAALLKIAEGPSIRAVAAFGCLKPRDRDTLCASRPSLPAPGASRSGHPKGARARARLLSRCRLSRLRLRCERCLNRRRGRRASRVAAGGWPVFAQPSPGSAMAV